MSQSVYTEYLRHNFVRGLTTNSTDADFGAIIPTTTKPVTVDSTTPTANLIVLPCSGSETQIIPFGQDTDNDQLTIRATLWRKVPRTTNTGLDLWVSLHVGTFELTLSAATGVAAAPVINTEFFVDTITEVGTTWYDALVSVHSPANNTPGIIRVTTIGFDLIQIDGDINLASGTDGTAWNALVSRA